MQGSGEVCFTMFRNNREAKTKQNREAKMGYEEYGVGDEDNTLDQIDFENRKDMI